MLAWKFNNIFIILFLSSLAAILIFLVVHFPHQAEEKLSPRNSSQDCSYLRQICNAVAKQKKVFLWGNFLKMSFEDPFDCKKYIVDNHYFTSTLSAEENTFPLAYSVVIHKEFSTFERVFRAIYVPHNVYCVHVDAKAPTEYKEAVERVINCFPNAFLVSKAESVVYGGISRLQADLNCMKDLLKFKIQWKYFLNICGQDFPLKTNKEIVQHLKKCKGKNVASGFLAKTPIFTYRTKYIYVACQGDHGEHSVKMLSTMYPKSPPPYNLTIYHGSAYVALTRRFVEFIFSNKLALDFLKWSRNTFSPDEHYWATLNKLQGVPDAMLNSVKTVSTRIVKWKAFKEKEGDCHGRYVRDICVYGHGDLKWLLNSDGLFANKFELETYPPTLECLEISLRERALKQSEIPVKASWYF